MPDAEYAEYADRVQTAGLEGTVRASTSYIARAIDVDSLVLASSPQFSCVNHLIAVMSCSHGGQ